VVAYCRHVAGAADAGAAAADAFARFRVAVVAAGDTTSLNPEALLVSATRSSAAARAQASGQGDCAEVPMLLVARAEKTIAPADLERLESHLEQCWACRAPVARFKAAERAYRDPPEKTVDDLLAAQIVGALIAAVPSAPPPKPIPQSPNGSAEQVAAAAAPPAPVEQPTEQFAVPDTDEPLPSDADTGPELDTAADAAIAPALRRRREKKTVSGAGAVLGRLRSPAKERRPRKRVRREPRPPRQAPMLGAPLERSARSRPALRLSRVLPIVLVLLALLAALYVSGVFGGDDPASTPAVSAPAATPAEVELDAVPGARDATADDVESAKARARGEDVPADNKQKEEARTDSAPAAASPPPAPANPRPAAPAVSPNNPINPPPPPPAERESEPSDDKQIDAGSGATGAEQIPPAGDASEVPDLAPPTDPAASP